MNILVVGGLGFLGKACLKKLANENVTILGRTKLLSQLKSQKHQYHQLDISDYAAVELFLEKTSYSHLLYLSWPLTPPHDVFEHIEFAKVSLHFLKSFAQRNHSARVVMVGSIHESGMSPGLIPDVLDSYFPKNLYGLSKKYVYDCSKILFQEIAPKLSFCWLRLSNVYGPQDHPSKFLTKLILSLVKKLPFTILNPNQAVDFVHVNDAAQGIILALNSSYEGSINIGSGTGVLLQDLEEHLKSLLNESASNKQTSILKHHSLDKIIEQGSVLDISRAFEILEYKPNVLFQKGITECLHSILQEAK